MKRLTDSEWIILKALWGKAPQSLKEIIAAVKQQGLAAWGYKTYHTYLRNMCEKGLIVSEERNLKDKLYSAAVSEEEALKAESDSIIDRSGYFGSVGRLVLTMAENNQLTKEDRQELLQLAKLLEKENGGNK